MRSIIFSFALLMASTTINCVDKSKTQGKKVTAQLTEYQIFAQKYEAAFGEKPSAQVWNLGKDSCMGSGCGPCGTDCDTIGKNSCQSCSMCQGY